MHVTAYAGLVAFASYDLVADPGELVCDPRGHCHRVGGGTFTTELPVDHGLACGATTAGTARFTDVFTGLAVSRPVTWVGQCQVPTTTTLSIPARVDTGWTAAANPARVTAGSTVVTVGTTTITVNGVSLCSYSAGAQTGCSLANLPAGTDQVQASYSGSAVPSYEPSSVAATVTVIQVQTPVKTTSANWAGYVDTGDMYSSVSGRWIVPTANCGNFPTGDLASTSAAWVGIDGWGNTPVEQIGTDSNCASFAGEYHAWWQMYPSPPAYIGIPWSLDTVSPGDVMTASVTSTGAPGTFTLTIKDDTRGWTYSTTQANAAATGGSAECIVEQPAALGIPLTNFGSVAFTQCKATGSSGVAAPVWDHPSGSVAMSSGSTTKAVVSPLSNDGTDFTVTWLHS